MNDVGTAKIPTCNIYIYICDDSVDRTFCKLFHDKYMYLYYEIKRYMMSSTSYSGETATEFWYVHLSKNPYNTKNTRHNLMSLTSYSGETVTE